jgi:hypothetical protein
MNGPSQLRWAIIGYIMLLGLMPSPAHASDCPPDDPSRADCQSAASTARSPLVPITGAVAGGMAGWVLGQALDPKTKSEERAEAETKADPCQVDLDRVVDASIRADIFQSARQHWQQLAAMLDNQYETARQAAFWGASLDVAFMAGSMWTKPAAAMLGVEIAEQTLAQKLREAALKSMGQELLKSLATSPEAMKWWDVLYNKPGEGAAMTGAQEALTKLISDGEMQKWAIYRGIDPDGPVGKGLRTTIENEFISPMLDSLLNLKGLYDTGAGALEGRQQLQAIAEQIRDARRRLAQADSEFDDALAEKAGAMRTLQRCRQIWAQK